MATSNDFLDNEKREPPDTIEMYRGESDPEIIKRLKRHRAACKGHFTRAVSHIVNELTVDSELAEIRKYEQSLFETYERFTISCKVFERVLTDEIDVEESNVYFREAELRFLTAKDKIVLLLETKQSVMAAEENNGQEVDVRDSVSQNESKSSHSHSSRRSKSSIRSMQLQNATKFAALQAEASILKQRQSIENEKLKIAQMQQKLELDTKLAKLKAKEKVCKEFIAIERGIGDNYDSVSVTPSFMPVGSFQGNAVKELRANRKVSRLQNPMNACKPSLPSQKYSLINSLPQHILATPDEIDASNFNFEPLAPTGTPHFCPKPEAQKLGEEESIALDDGILYLETMKQLATATLLPKSELMTFDGNPLKFSLFMRSFENNVEKSTSDSSKKLQLLIQFCIGKARKLIESCILLEPEHGYLKAKRLLFERFGGAYKISSSWLAKISDGPQIKANDGEALQDLADDIESCEIALEATGKLSYLNNEDRLVRIVQRCPVHIKSRWISKVQDIRMENRDPNIEDLRKLIRIAANERTDPVYGKILESERNNPKLSQKVNGRWDKPKAFGTSVMENQQSKTMGSSECKCYFCKGNHKLENCREFRNQDGDKQFKFIRAKKLCDNCLSSFHFSAGCKRKKDCTVPGCEIVRKHLGVLHNSIQEFEMKRVIANETKGDEVKALKPSKNEGSHEEKRNSEGTKFTGWINKNGAERSAKGLPIVPVKVKCKGSPKVIETYALLDSGSTASFCSESLQKDLKLHGKDCQIQVATVNGISNTYSTVVSTIDVFDVKENFCVSVDVFSIKCLNISKDSIGSQEDIEKWPHLKDISMPERITNGEVDLLLGVDVPEALESLEVRKSEAGGPFAIKTKFGWTLNGPLGRSKMRGVNCLFSQSNCCDEDVRLQLVKYFDREFDDSLSVNKKAMSVDDRKALKIVEDSICFKEGHYQIPIPWKDCEDIIPNNRFMAERRLEHLSKKLSKDKLLKDSYVHFMNSLIADGYAKKISEDEENRIACYLPHHSVANQKKPDKVRIVFDCAAKYNGKSLNDRVLQGPDLTNSLIGVLCRFRQEEIAIVADIEAMYHQVRVDPKDIGALRFLWYPDGDITKMPDEYQMLVHLFGGVWSSFCASFALRRTAIDNADSFPEEVINAVLRDFYVDDFLKSMKTSQEAILMQKQLTEVLSRGGFHLTKWNSNCRDVLDVVPRKERSKEIKNIDIHDEKLPTGRTLGMEWNREDDIFQFIIDIKEIPPTRRNMLKIIASIFDPLGFVAPCILPAKILLQESCHRLNWDEEISNRDQVAWKRWIAELPKLEKEFKMKRCIKSSEDLGHCKNEIHHFADASEKGYGAVSYIRSKYESGKVHCAFLFAKSRVAPIKKISIPRLELTAAVLAVKVDSMLRNELEVEISDSIFWTDSKSVLCYINNTDKRFHTFVANRISLIHDASDPMQWHYIESSMNPADNVSRGMNVNEFLRNDRWSKGPEFLWEANEKWSLPQSIEFKISSDDKEVKRHIQTFKAQSNEVSMTSLLFSKFSEWFKLKRAVAWFMRYKNWIRKKTIDKDLSMKLELPRGRLSVDEINGAEHAIITCVQRECFKEDIDCLQRGVAVKRSSMLLSLDPILNDDGIVCVGGRLKHAPYGVTKGMNQTILPKNHHISDIITEDFHRKSGHLGQEYVLSLIREKYWIIRARVMIKQVVNDCFVCKRRSCLPMNQKMSNLPGDRISSNKPPFTAVGIDYFGPFIVKRGRALVKRYGVIFTCLVIRAVHIEIAHCLDTNSFINALKRFFARRGIPDVIRSDNGTNLKGGERELREVIQSWNHDQIHDFMLQKEIRWIFNPPTASHMGGAWERMIRSIRKVFTALLKNQSLDDEGLQTLMCEVEAILNARPLTKVSDDPRDLKAITPNHLLLLRADTTLPCGIITEKAHYCNRRWKQIQQMADVFWKRWIREYLPGLQVRQKWKTPKRSLLKNDIVIVIESSVPRNCWPLGRVLEVFSGRDGLVRTARIKTAKGELVRPITKLCLLEGED